MNTTLVLAVAAAAGIVGCADAPAPEPPPAAFPEGTVLTVGGHPVTAADVDQYVDMVAMIEPEFVLRDHRRKVLNNITLPVAAGAALDPQARDAAYRKAQRLLAAARETGDVPGDAPEPQILTGSFREVGMVSWSIAKDQEPMTFSELHETPGAWTFFKLIATAAEPGEFEPTSQVTIVRYDLYYLPQEGVREFVQSALDGFEITIVDPEWEPIVPPLYLYESGTPQR